MGLFGNKELRELRELLDAMQGSTTRDIDAIRAGNPPPLTDLEAKGGVFAEMTFNNRITRAANLVKRLAAKGKQAEAEALLAEFRSKPLPQALLFRSAEPTREASNRAALDAAEQLETIAPDPKQELNDEQWRSVIDEIRVRAELEASPRPSSSRGGPG